MKLSAFVATAAVISGSFLIPNPAEADQSLKWKEPAGYTYGYPADAYGRAAKRSSSVRRTSTNTSSSRCPAGTSYHKIKRGLFLARKTVAEGCFTPYEAAQLNMQADSNEQRRRSNVMRNINANKQRQCFGSARSYGNTTYGNATCY